MTFDDGGPPVLVLHRPNDTPRERAELHPLREHGGADGEGPVLRLA
ncbi:hypothetical protein ACFT2C_15455 [Promicromonospora sp. NPDC057138]